MKSDPCNSHNVPGILKPYDCFVWPKTPNKLQVVTHLSLWIESIERKIHPQIRVKSLYFGPHFMGYIYFFFFFF